MLVIVRFSDEVPAQPETFFLNWKAAQNGHAIHSDVLSRVSIGVSFSLCAAKNAIEKDCGYGKDL